MKKVTIISIMLYLSLTINANMFTPIDGYVGMTWQQKVIVRLFDNVILPSAIIVGVSQAGVDLMNIPEENKHQLLVDTVKEYYSENSEINMKYKLNKDLFKKLPKEVYKHSDCIVGIINYNGRIIIIENDECKYKKCRGILY